MVLPRKTLEKKLFKSGYGYICAVDEVGMGCLAGPVVVCAVGFTNHFYNRVHRKYFRLKDSKLLTPKHREKFAGELMREKDMVYALSYAYPKTIDKLNIYQTARLAMKRAVKKVVSSKYQVVSKNPKPLNTIYLPLNTMILVDGKTKIEGLKMEQRSIVKGDRKVFAIACASVIAKVYRDRMMVRYAKKYPGYGFEKHKGYGTKMHKEKIVALGLTPLHRRSFRCDS